MNREEKQGVVDLISEKLSAHQSFYMTDASALSVAQINQLRRQCFEKGVDMKVAKNTLIKRAMEASETDYSELYESLPGPTYLMFSSNAAVPAQVIKEFRKSAERPLIKAAYIDTAVYIGDDNLDMLSKLKSKEELIGEVIALLQSPIKNVIGALKSGGDTIGGIVKTLSERPEDAPAEEAPAEEAPAEEAAAPEAEAKEEGSEEATEDTGAAEAATDEAAEASAEEASDDAGGDAADTAEEAAGEGDQAEESKDDEGANASEGGDDAADSAEESEDKGE